MSDSGRITSVELRHSGKHRRQGLVSAGRAPDVAAQRANWANRTLEQTNTCLHF